MRKKRTLHDKNRVYVECSDTIRRVKGKILNKDDRSLEVEMPTGYILTMHKKTRKGYYSFRFGLLEFLSDGREVP